MNLMIAEHAEVSAARPAGPDCPAPAGHHGAPVSAAQLEQIVREIAAEPGRWRPVVRFRAGERWYARLSPADPAAAFEVWLLSWLPGQQTGFHDHGDAVGAFAIADGELQESTARPGRGQLRSRVLGAGMTRAFGAAYVHDVSNISAAPAVSVHAYSPPLAAMRRYELTSTGLALTGIETSQQSW